MASDYMCAGARTVNDILENFYRDPHRGFTNNFTRLDLSNFFSQTCNSFLHSFGQNLPKSKKVGIKDTKAMDKYIKAEVKLLKNMRQRLIFTKTKLVVDSGGYEVSKGRLDEDQSRVLDQMYHRFLYNHCRDYDRAFTLDFVPGQGKNPKFFKDFNDIYYWNLRSYTRAASLPESVRHKIVYIHHFRTPALWKIFMKIMRDNNLFKEFKYHGTGGMVANLASDANTPCITYILPLIPLLNEAIKDNRDYLYFHVLGIGNPRDIFFYEFFKTHVKKVHNIDLHISYDSAGAMFHQLLNARYIPVYDRVNDMIVKMYLKTNELTKRFGRKDKLVIDTYNDEINKMAHKYKFLKIPIRDISDVYQVCKICGGAGTNGVGKQCSECHSSGWGTFYDNIKVYSMLYSIESVREIQEVSKYHSDKLYPLYEAGELEEFNREVELVTRKFNHERITRKQKAKTNSLIRSLDMLSSLDEDHCEYIVNRYLAKDEFKHLDPSCPLKF